MKIAFPFLLSFVAAVPLTELSVAAQVLSPSLDNVVDTLPLDPDSPLAPSDAAAGSGFGAGVAVSGDRAAIVAPGAAPSGAVYVFERHGGAWTEVARIEPDPGTGDAFGSSVSISGDRLAVGSGNAAYVFTRQRGGWVQSARLVSPDGAPGDGFGSEVAVEGDRVAVGAPNALDPWDIPAGVVHIFETNGRGWQRTARLDHPLGGYGGDGFSASLALQGDTLVAGAPLSKVGGHDYGQAFAFRRVGSQWNHVGTFDATGDNFGFMEMGMSIALDGDLAVVGAPGDGPGLGFDAPGAAYVYRRGSTGWAFAAKLAADDELLDSARFGSSVAVRDGTVLVGASFGDVDGGAPGSVYVFEETRIGWVQTDEWAAEFGGQLALGDGFALVGTASSDVAGANSGAAVLRALDGRLPTFVASPSHVQFWQDVPGGGAAGAIDGSQQRLLLDATPVHGGLPFLVLGSMSGTAPGTLVDGFVLPLVEDAYFQDSVNDPGSTPLVGSTGVLDVRGRAVTRFVVPPGGFDQGLVGTTFHHACVVLDPATQSVVFASNAAPVTLVY